MDSRESAPSLRELIEASWRERRGSLRPGSSGRPKRRRFPGLRERLFQRVLQDLDEPGRGSTIDRDRVRRILGEMPDAGALSSTDRDRLEQELVDEMEGLGPVASLLRDPTISDILVNGPDEVWIDRFGRLERTSVHFDDRAHLTRLLSRVVANQGRHLDEASPHVDVRLPDGSRLNAVLPPLCNDGPVLSIRRSRIVPFRLEELIAFGTLDRGMADLLATAVRQRLNLVVSGGAATGKTTLLNVLSCFIPDEERVVTIEETAELRLEHPHVISLEARLANAEGRGEITLRTLVRNALRMRADRIVVGEVRGGEAYEMLQAMNVGHDGSLTTVHANSPQDALRRLESLVLQGSGDLPGPTVRELLGSAVDLVAQLTRFPDGVRRITSLSQVVSDEGRTAVRDLYRFESSGGTFAATTSLPPMAARLGLESEPS